MASLTGGLGPDTLVGGLDPDQIFGGSGNDYIDAGTGDDYVRGEDGDDRIFGGLGFDDINGNKGDDTAYGGDGADWVVGGQGNDLLFGDAGDDIVYGNLGNDTLDGGQGNDLIRGGQGNDLVFGGAGSDLIFGDRGDDTLTGGSGADIFEIFRGAGIDRIMDFSVAEGDKLRIDGNTPYVLRQIGGDTVVDLGNGDQFTLSGSSMASLGLAKHVEAIAHRELAGGGAEETLKSFDLAYAKGLRSMEFDLQVTKDGAVILMHDLTVNRTTTGTGDIVDLTFSQIRDLGIKTEAGGQVPTWQEVIDWAKNHSDVQLYAEVKGYRSLLDISLMLEPLKAAELESRTIFTSFRSPDLQYLRANGFNGELVQWYTDQPANIAAAIAALARMGGPVSVGFMGTTLLANPLDVTIARNAGVDMLAWTIDDTKTVDSYLALDVHRIVTNVSIPSAGDDGWIIQSS